MSRNNLLGVYTPTQNSSFQPVESMNLLDFFAEIKSVKPDLRIALRKSSTGNYCLWIGQNTNNGVKVIDTKPCGPSVKENAKFADLSINLMNDNTWLVTANSLNLDWKEV